jgi:GntR family transcriptional repressor for pyruvate dehydrogenase complex
MTSKSTLVSSVSTEIESTLLGSAIAVGDKLPSERELAARMGVSRPVIRESLRQLQERGLVEAQPGRGTFYRPAEPADAADSLNRLFRRAAVTPAQLIVARKMLECEAAALAAAHRTDDDCAMLERTLHALSSSASLLEQVKADISFHDGIAQTSANPVIRLMFASISDITVGLMVRSLSDRQVRQRGLPLHDEVFTAIVAGDPERARTAMNDHLGAAEQLYGTDLDREIGDLVPAGLRDALAALCGPESSGGHPLQFQVETTG